MAWAIVYSKRTLCIITTNFVENNFCKFKFDMSLHVDMASNRKRLVVIMQEDIAEDDLSDIRNYMNNFTYLTRNGPFLMKRLTYRLAQNRLGGNDDGNTPLLLGDGCINHRLELLVIRRMYRKLCKFQWENIK